MPFAESRSVKTAATLALICAISRFAARARSLWDWDEALFCLGMRSFDVAQHHPHPPGFPAYIALGRTVRLILQDDFQSLQAINLVAGMLLFPAIYVFARELNLRFSTSVIAATLCAFFPNVWFYGGTAFSDVASLTIVVFAAALLLRGRRDAIAFLAGALLLGIAIAIRPQNALVGVVPFVLAARKRRARETALAAGIIVALTAIAYGAAAAATGVDAYRAAVRGHSEYIAHVDSFRSPLRPPLWRLTALFFGKQYSSPLLSAVTTLFVVIAVVMAIRRKDRSLALIALTFGPVALFAWLFLDRYTVNRFAIAYAPMFALFAADGVAQVARRRSIIESIIGAALIGGFIAYTLPALTTVRRDVAPSVLAMEAAKAHFDPAADDLFVATDMAPFVDYFMPGVQFIRVLDERAMILSRSAKTPRLIAEIIPTSPRGFVFRRPRGRLWNITRRHYYGAAYAEIDRFAQFVSGWEPPQRMGQDEWRWMRASSVTMLPSSHGESLLRLGVIAEAPAIVSVAMNGRPLDSFTVRGEAQREWHILDPIDGPNKLEISTDRDRAIRLRYLSWATY